jgi:hypothetical protein
MNAGSRWLDWEPQTRIFSICLKEAPTKPTESGFVGFVGPRHRQIQKIEGEPDPAELSRASAILGQAGVRLMRLESGDAVGIWSDLDSPAIRNALRILGSGELPVLYLDGPNVPLRYKLRRVPGEPVPNSVREAMEGSSEPWKVRSRMPRNFVLWPQAEAKACTIDPRTGIRPTCEWGASCGRGFVSNPRFGANTRKWRRLND